MTTDARNLEKMAGRLAAKDRARLALRLIESLDPGEDEDADEQWLDEAEQRLADYESGKIEAESADAAIREIEQNLQRGRFACCRWPGKNWRPPRSTTKTIKLASAPHS